MYELEIGTADITETLKTKNILCLYKDGTWTTGQNIRQGWVVMVDVTRKLAVCVQDFHGRFVFREGFYWHQCDEDTKGDWLIVNYIFSVYFGNSSAMIGDDEVIGRILLTNYSYIDKNNNIETAS